MAQPHAPALAPVVAASTPPHDAVNANPRHSGHLTPDMPVVERTEVLTPDMPVVEPETEVIIPEEPLQEEDKDSEMGSDYSRKEQSGKVGSSKGSKDGVPKESREERKLKKKEKKEKRQKRERELEQRLREELLKEMQAGLVVGQRGTQDGNATVRREKKQQAMSKSLEAAGTKPKRPSLLAPKAKEQKAATRPRPGRMAAKASPKKLRAKRRSSVGD